MIIYDEKCKSEIKRKKTLCGVAYLGATAIEGIIIAVSLSLFNKENYLFFQILLSVVTFIYISFCYLLYRLKLKSIVNLEKLLKKFEKRELETVVGAYDSLQNKTVSDSGVSFAVLGVDNGTKYRDETVLRELLLESSFVNPFEEGRRYIFKVIDNVILEYKNE